VASVGKVKHQLQSQLRELEPLPELLRSSELRLQQTTEQLEQFKQLHDHDMRLINDLTAKVMMYYKPPYVTTTAATTTIKAD